MRKIRIGPCIGKKGKDIIIWEFSLVNVIGRTFKEDRIINNSVREIEKVINKGVREIL
jgi:hypothetical protein